MKKDKPRHPGRSAERPAALALKKVGWRDSEGKQVLDGLDIALSAGSITTVLSADGDERRALAHLLAGLTQPDCGQLVWGTGGDGATTGREQGRPKVSAVYGLQGDYAELSITNNLFLGSAGWRWQPAHLQAQAREILSFLGLDWPLEGPRPTLSEAERYVLTLMRCILAPAQLYVLEGIVDNVAPALFARAMEYLKPRLEAGALVVLCSEGTVPLFAGTSRVLCLRDGHPCFWGEASGNGNRPWPVMIANNPARASLAVANAIQRTLAQTRHSMEFAGLSRDIGRASLNASFVEFAFLSHDESLQMTDGLSGSGLGVVVARYLMDTSRHGHPVLEKVQSGGSEYELLPLSGRQTVFGLIVFQRSAGSPPGADSAFLSGFSKALNDLLQEEHLDARIKQGQRLDTLGAMASGLVHDFNNTLHVIQAASGLARASVTDGATIRHLDAVGKAVDSASKLTEQLLSFARRHDSLMVAVDLHKVISDSLIMLKGAAAGGRRVEARLAAIHPTVMGETNPLQNAFLNIALNACQASSPKDGLITITTSNVKARPEWRDLEGARMSGPCIMVQFTDNGAGMSPETLKRVFEPFFSTRTHQGGTGLGLPAVFNTIKSHHGLIEISSRPGIGTEVRLVLPCAAPDSKVEEVPSEPGALQRQKHCLLVCDDNELVRSLLAESLRLFDYDVIEAATGAEAVQAYTDNPDGIHLAILDYRMPEMNGAECFAKLRAIRPGVRAIMLSGYMGEINVKGLIAEGIKGVYFKPINQDKLRAAIREALA